MSTTTDRDFELRLLANLPETSDATVVDDKPSLIEVVVLYDQHPQYLRQDICEAVQIADEQNSRLAVVVESWLPSLVQRMVGHPVDPRLIRNLQEALDEQHELGLDPGGVCNRLGVHYEAAADKLEAAVDFVLDQIVGDES